MTFKRDSLVRMRKIQDRILLVRGPVVFETNEVGLSIWTLCDGTRSLQAIAGQLAAQFEGTSATELLEDCQSFIEQLVTVGLMQEVAVAHA